MRTPVFIILLFVGAFAAFAFYRRFISKAPIYYTDALSNNYNAQTIPPFGIFIKTSELGNDELLNHELIHWQQFKEKGLLSFYYQYIKQLIKFGYDKAPFEKQARINESDFCIENYTFCVKNGLAQTVYNPEFRNN